MIVVSDTSPITSLSKIGLLHLLEELFGEVYIPQAVYDELRRTHTELPSFIQKRSLEDVTSLTELSQLLDPGEAEAILLYNELKADYLVMDEKKGRREARRRGIQIVGLAGILLIAKKKGWIDSLEEMLDRLKLEAGFYLSDAVKEEVLVQAEEK